MKKRIVTLLLALVMLVSLISCAIPTFAADGITLRLHYHREDGAYEGWEMWFWDNSGTTKLDPPYQFVEENGEMVSTISVKPGTMEIGFIVRFGNWEAKDIAEDQFINLAGILGGTVDVYVESGVKGYELVKGADVKEGVVIVNSKYDPNKQRITIKMSSDMKYEPDVNTFKVYNKEGSVAVESVKPVGQYYYVTLAEALDLSRGYNIEFEGTEYAVGMPDYYASEEFEKLYTYTGDDLGATYTSANTKLRVWAPTAVEVNVNLYTNGDKDAQPDYVSQVAMTKDVNGTWVATLDGDQNGKYYTYEVIFDTEIVEACDPYARTTGVNGDRAMIIDLASTNPEGWDKDVNPFKGNITDAFIYELHVRDISSDASSGHSEKNVGKYLGVVERGTKVPGTDIPTGLDHIVNLGVTHVHLLPVYDFGSVDESTLDDPNSYKFNWGYDPQNYNVPEGSYSSDPYNGEVRVKEFKQMVKGMHDAGLAVIMDVVYNHVYNTTGYCFNKIVPSYFSRPGSNGSGCGNDTASERAMVSKYIVDSVNYWADEYHIDGFRFDLVGLIDVKTINELVKTVKEKHPETIFYGEGWTMSTVLTKDAQLATQTNAKNTPNFAYFSDNIRNLVKGNTFGGVSAGFISGGAANTMDLNACFRGMPSWCPSPSQSINYISCHDNNTLFDHIMMAAKNNTTEEHISMNKLGVAFYMAAQGVPFFQAGEEMLRSKPNGDGTFNENSYNASDAVNSIKWSDLQKEEYQAVYEYYKGLIAFRKAHPALRLATANDVDATVTNVNGLPEKVVGYNVAGGINGETAENILCFFNPNNSAATVTLPEGEWNICVNGEKAGVYSLGKASGTAEVSALSALILVKGDVEAVPEGEGEKPGTETPAPDTDKGGEKNEKNNNMIGLWIALGAVVVVAAAVVVVLIISKKK